MQEDLKILLKVQEKDVRIRDLETEKTEKPAFIERLKSDFESKQKNLESLKEQIKRLDVEKKNLELDIESKNATVLKYKGQTATVKTNAEYKALEAEIKNLEEETRKVEDKVLELMMGAEEVKKSIAVEEQFLNTEKDKVLMEEQKVKDQLVKNDRELEALRAEKDALVSNVNEYVLEKYKLIFENKDDLAIVPAEHGTCGGCSMKLTSQLVNELKRSQEVITCENCARILYYQIEVREEKNV